MAPMNGTGVSGAISFAISNAVDALFSKSFEIALRFFLAALTALDDDSAMWEWLKMTRRYSRYKGRYEVTACPKSRKHYIKPCIYVEDSAA